MNGARTAALAVLLATTYSHAAMAQDPGTLAVSSTPGPITLGAAPTDVTLVAPRGSSVADELKNAAARQVYLTFTGAQAQTVPATTYNVYVGLPPGADPSGTSDIHYVGTLSFFNAASGRAIDISLNLTPRLGQLLAGNAIANDVRVTIVPAGAPPEAAAPQIGSVRITAR
jgi:hypothetical protein